MNHGTRYSWRNGCTCDICLPTNEQFRLQNAQRKRDKRRTLPEPPPPPQEPPAHWWAKHAACQGQGAIMYPNPPVEGVGGNPDYEPARALCRNCVVRLECLTYAVENNEPAGMWGGLNPRERRGPRRALDEGWFDPADWRVKLAPKQRHGTIRAALDGCPCHRCRWSLMRPRSHKKMEIAS